MNNIYKNYPVHGRKIGERLHPLISKLSERPGKVTGMLLNSYTDAQLLEILKDPTALKETVDSAHGALADHAKGFDVILDVDTGVDDAHALLLALRHPRLNVIAVTTVAGNSDIHTVTSATLQVLDAAQAPFDLPVAMGCAQPLIEPTHYCPQIHGNDALGDLLPPLPKSKRNVVKEHAVSYLASVLRTRIATNQPPITLIALAPLTNIGMLVRMEPDLVKQGICRIVWMGGACKAGGNAAAWSEANAAYDPEAAHIVLSSCGVPVLMYTWDVYLKVAFDLDDLRKYNCLKIKKEMDNTPPPTLTRGNKDQIGLHTNQKCDKGHGLIRFTRPSDGFGCDVSDGFGCDVCEQGVPEDTVMYGCDECDYDICTSCEDAREETKKTSTTTETKELHQKLRPIPTNTAQPFIGSRITLISGSHIRYEGELNALDEQEATVSLQDVQMFGTEGRRGSNEILPNNKTYSLIQFRANDILELQVEADPVPQVPPACTKPAIFSTTEKKELHEKLRQDMNYLEGMLGHVGNAGTDAAFEKQIQAIKQQLNESVAATTGTTPREDVVPKTTCERLEEILNMKSNNTESEKKSETLHEASQLNMKSNNTTESEKKSETLHEASESTSSWTQLSTRLLLRDMQHFNMNSAQIGDAGAVALLLCNFAEKDFEVRHLPVAIELEGKHTRGMTVCDFREEVFPPDKAKEEANVFVVMNVNADTLKEIYASVVLQ